MFTVSAAADGELGFAYDLWEAVKRGRVQKRTENGETGDSGVGAMRWGDRWDGRRDRGALHQAPPFYRAENHSKAPHTETKPKTKETNQSGYGVNAKQNVTQQDTCLTA